MKVVRLEKRKVILFIDIVIIILCSGSVFKTTDPLITYLAIIPLFFHINTFIHEVQKPTPVFVGILFMIIWAMALHLTTTILYYVLLIIYVASMYAVSAEYTFSEINRMFTKIMNFISAVAVLFYYLVNGTDIGNSFKTITNTNNAVYKSIGIYVYNPAIIERNHGCFWEPGVFATMIVFAMVFLLFRLNETRDPKERRNIILGIVVQSIALYTTSSSAGIVLFGLFLLLIFTMRMSSNLSVLAKIGSWIGVLIVIYVLLNYSTLIEFFGLDSNYFFARIAQKEGFLENSRYFYFNTDWNYFLQNPILGYGIVQTNSLVASGGGDTCTSIYALLVFGIFGLQYTLFYIIGILKLKVNGLSKLIMVVMLLCIINKEPHLVMLMTWLIMFMLFRPDVRIKKEVSDEVNVFNQYCSRAD